MKWNELDQTRKLWIGIGAAVVVVALVAGAVLLGGQGDTGSGNGSSESTSTAGSGEASGSVETTEPARETAAPSEADYEQYVYVMNVTTEGDTSTVYVDFFEILTDDAAQKYALENGLQVPMNGIMPINPKLENVAIPMAADVDIQYATGGVEKPELKATTAEALGKWVNGDVEAMPGSRTNMWKITVKGGVVTSLHMIVIAD